MKGRGHKFEWQDRFLEADVPPRAKVVGQAIANRWNGGDSLPIVSTDYLVKATGLTKRTVERALSDLRKAGWIAQARRGGRRGDATWGSRYRLTYPNPNPPSVTPNPPSVTAQSATGGGRIDLYLDLSSRPTRTLSVDRASSPRSSESEGDLICFEPCEWSRSVGVGDPCKLREECWSRHKLLTTHPIEVLKGDV